MLHIVKYPAKILFNISERVEDDEIDHYKLLVEDMLTFLASHNALGLAAPQVDVNKRIIIYRGDDDKFHSLINPVVKCYIGKLTSRAEGCLSIPNIRRDIKRSRTLVVEGIGRDSTIVKIKPRRNITSIVLQHEIDHLNGITILDSSKKRNLSKQREV